MEGAAENICFSDVTNGNALNQNAWFVYRTSNANTLTDFAYLFDRGFPQGQRLNFLRFAASKSTKRIWNCICCLVACTCSLMHIVYCLSPADVTVFVWAHGLLFVVGAMCSPVYCLTPHFLLSHYCFSYTTRVFLVRLPMCSPGVCSPMRFRCLMSCECYVCLCCRSPSRGGFCFFWLLNDPLFICTWVLASSLLTRHDCNDRLDVCVLMT